MRDIDLVARELRTLFPDISIEQIRVEHPGADDDGLWFFRHPSSPIEAQLESTFGACPFLFESDTRPPVQATTALDAVRMVSAALGLDGGRS